MFTTELNKTNIMGKNKRPKTSTSFKTSGLTITTIIIIAVWYIALTYYFLNC